MSVSNRMDRFPIKFSGLVTLDSNVCRPFFCVMVSNISNMHFQFYDVVSVTETRSKGTELMKTTRIKKKKAGSAQLPHITLCNFLKMAKEGIW